MIQLVAPENVITNQLVSYQTVFTVVVMKSFWGHVFLCNLSLAVFDLFWL